MQMCMYIVNSRSGFRLEGGVRELAIGEVWLSFDEGRRIQLHLNAQNKMKAIHLMRLCKEKILQRLVNSMRAFLTFLSNRCEPPVGAFTPTFQWCVIAYSSR